MPLLQPGSRSPKVQARLALAEADIANGRATVAITRSDEAIEVAGEAGEQADIAVEASLVAVDAASVAVSAAETVGEQVTLVFTFQQVRDSYADDGILSATDAGVITIAAHDRHYLNVAMPVAVDGGSVSGLAAGNYHVHYDDPDFAGGAVTYAASTAIEQALASLENPARHYVGAVTVPTAGNPPTTGNPGSGSPSWSRPFTEAEV